MSVDQNHSCKAIMDEFCPPSLQFRALGKVSHARWLTLAIHINFLYRIYTNQCEDIVHLATFVVTIYSYLWPFSFIQSSVCNFDWFFLALKMTKNYFDILWHIFWFNMQMIKKLSLSRGNKYNVPWPWISPSFLYHSPSTPISPSESPPSPHPLPPYPHLLPPIP